MITVNSFFSGSLATVDSVIGNFVNVAYTQFVQGNAGLITMLFTLYIMLLGFKFLNHSHHFNLMGMVQHMITMLCVYGLVMNWQLYHLFVYNIFTNEPAYIADILVKSTGQFQGNGTIAGTLDGIYDSVVNASAGLMGQVSLSGSGIAFVFYAFLVFVIGSLMCIFALLLFVYAKMMMAIALALGPIFILFILWQPTRGMFDAWLNKLVTIALIPIVTSAILVLMLSVVHVTLPAINQPADHLQFYGLAPFLGLSLATTMILSQVFRISSALGGGLTLASLSTGAAIASTAIQKSGLPQLGSKAMNFMKHANRSTHIYSRGKRYDR